jgi:putative permease
MNFSLQGLLKLLLDPRFITLVVASLLVVGLIALIGNTLIPFVMAVVLTYFLDGGVKRLSRVGMPRFWAFLLVFLLFLAAYVWAFVGPLRLAVRQGLVFARELPRLEVELQVRLMSLRDAPLSFLSEAQQRELAVQIIPRLRDWGFGLLTKAAASLPDVASWFVYLTLLPLLVFFFLKDKDALLEAFSRFLPKDRELIDKIWLDVEEKTASYVRGTLWRMLIVGLATGAAFLLLGFDYGALMGALTGLSVLIPYVGAVMVALPLALLGYAQWGLTWDLGNLMIAYAVIQILDGYVLVPYLFSIAVKLHPVTILLATFVFGSLWGFWGLIFAIPLATLVKSFLLTVIEHQDQLA